jgi:hypothetical protein
LGGLEAQEVEGCRHRTVWEFRDVGMFGRSGKQEIVGGLGVREVETFFLLNSTEKMGGCLVRKFWKVWRFEKSGVF